MSLRWPASTRSSSAGSGSVMASGRPRTRSAGQPLHPTAGHGVHPGDTIAVSYDVSRTELWTGTCTGDDHTGQLDERGTLCLQESAFATARKLVSEQLVLRSRLQIIPPVSNLLPMRRL